MNQASHNAPLCPKHGCKKVWHKVKSRKAGGQWACPACNRESSTRWAQANPEKTAARKHAWSCAWRQANPEKAAAHSRAWRQANPEKAAAHSRAWRQANPEKQAAMGCAWQQANPEKVAAKTQRRLARKRNATVPGQPVTGAVIAERLDLFDGCAYCGADEKLEVEHVAALASGGSHVASNLLGACRACNASKCDHPVEEWYRAQPFFDDERWQQIRSCTDFD